MDKPKAIKPAPVSQNVQFVIFTLTSYVKSINSNYYEYVYYDRYSAHICKM